MQSKRIGDMAERAASRKYNLQNVEKRTGYYDAKYSNGKKVQIKAALYERESGEPGVIRIWKHHLKALQGVRGRVVVVVINPENPERKVLKSAKIRPGKLLETGKFRETHQDAMKPHEEARIKWTEVTSL